MTCRDPRHERLLEALWTSDQPAQDPAARELEACPICRVRLLEMRAVAADLSRLGDALIPAMDKFKPEFIMHVSGADPYMEDQLGGLLLTFDGLARRDRLIYEAARSRKLPVCITLAGGYAFNPHDTVVIHANTAKVAAEVLAVPTA